LLSTIDYLSRSFQSDRFVSTFNDIKLVCAHRVA
jgi:hypothetical protein